MNEYSEGGTDVIQDPCSSAEDQLAELQLLTRAGHHDGLDGAIHRPPLVRRGTTLMLDIAEHPNEEDADEEDEEIAIESTGSSSFTALFAASRRLAGTSPTPPTSTMSASGESNMDGPTHTSLVQETRARRPTTLPTLCEEADDPASEDVPETRVHFEESPPPETDQGVRSSLCCATSTEERDEDARKSDPAFEEMLEQLPYDPSFLALSVTDLSVRNLLRARDAIARGCSTVCSSLEDQGAKLPLSHVRLVRTMVALDTLRLFLLRYEEEEVLLAVTDAIRRIYEQYVHDAGVGPLSHTHCVLTARNITRVVLLVHDSLKKKDATSSTASHNDNNNAERASPGKLRRSSTSPRKFSSASPSSWYARRSPSNSSLSSPSKAPLSPRSATPSSPCSPGSSSSSTPLRRSILACDGTHVLMNEKLAAYEHRGDAYRLPSFKVRRESDVAVEEAARRRQRSIHYGNEATKALRG